MEEVNYIIDKLLSNDIKKYTYKIKPNIIDIYNEKNDSYLEYVQSGQSFFSEPNYLNKINYTIEGTTDNKKLIKVFYGNKLVYQKYDNKFFIDSINNIKYYDIYVDNTLMPKFLYNQSEGLGEIRGYVNVVNCGTDANNFVVRCFSSDDHRFIGEYKIENGSYVIPNLDNRLNYNIILVDKSMTIEQKVLSFRKPTPYYIDQFKPFTILNEKIYYDDYKIYLKWQYDYNEENIINDYYEIFYSTGEIDLNNLEFYDSIKTQNIFLELDRNFIKYIYITSNYKDKRNFSKLIEIKNNISEINGVYNA